MKGFLVFMATVIVAWSLLAVLTDIEPTFWEVLAVLGVYFLGEAVEDAVTG